EGDALDAVLHGRKHHILSRLAILAPRRADGPCSLRVDVGEALQIAFRMAGRHPRHSPRRSTGPGTSAGDQLLGLAEWRVPEVVRVGLHPFQAALGAVDPDLQPVLVARGDL